MGIYWPWGAYCLLNEDLPWSVINPILASYYVSYCHLKIIYYYGKMVDRLTYTFSNYKVTELCGINGNFSSYHIVESNFLAGIFQAYDFRSLTFFFYFFF